MKGGRYRKTVFQTAGGGNGGDRPGYGAVAVLGQIGYRLSVFERGREGDPSSASGCVGGGKFWGL